MSDVLSQLAHIEKATAIQLLNKTSDFKLNVQLKLANEQRIINTKLQRLANKRQFFLTDKLTLPGAVAGVTIKIIIEKK